MNGHFLLCDVDEKNKIGNLMLMHIHSAIAVGDAILVVPICAIIPLSATIPFYCNTTKAVRFIKNVE